MRVQRVRSIGTRFGASFKRYDLTGLAAELAYRFLFAIFPFGLFLAALAAFVASWIGLDNPGQQIVAGLGDNLPKDLAASIQPELERVLGTASPGLVSIGAIAALWAATGGTSALMKAMNRAYEVEDTRSFLHKLLLGVGLTVLGSAAILVSFVTIVGGSLLTEQVAQQLGLSGIAWTFVTLLRWPAVFLVLVVAVAILFRFAPNVTASWRWVFAGAALFAVGWLLATWGFGFYVANFANYGATYGSLGGVIVLMLWFYLTGIMLVASAALIAAVAQEVEPEAIQARRDEIERDIRLQAGAPGLVARVRSALPLGRREPAREAAPAERRTGSPDRRRLERSPQH